MKFSSLLVIMDDPQLYFATIPERAIRRMIAIMSNARFVEFAGTPVYWVGTRINDRNGWARRIKYWNVDRTICIIIIKSHHYAGGGDFVSSYAFNIRYRQNVGDVIIKGSLVLNSDLSFNTYLTQQNDNVPRVEIETIMNFICKEALDEQKNPPTPVRIKKYRL